MVYFPFDDDAAHAAAMFFAEQEGGRINKMKLVKLMYIAERTSLRESESPMFGGIYYSLAFGPVISEVLDALNANHWKGLHVQQYEIVLEQGATPALDSLSDWGKSLIERVYSQFGSMSEWALSDMTHAEFAEWKDPGRGHREIIAIRDMVPEGGAELEELAGELSYLRELQ